MKLLTSLFVPALAAAHAFATFPLSSVKKETTGFGNIVPNRFIIEVDSISDIPTRRSLDPRAAHETLYDSLRRRGVGFTVDKEFNSQELFVGAAVTLRDAQDAATVSKMSGVKAIRPVVRIPAPKPVSIHVVTGVNDPAIPADTESTHIMTAIDKLHAQGIFGSGIKVGIIDTGVDYTNPVLGGGFGPGFKIIGGFDFVGDAYNGSNTPVPDDDPLDQCNGHGTHVSGIVGANPGNEFNISGVAYEASINMYRIFGCTGDTTDDVIVDALLRGVSDGNDILTMSLGGSSGWTEDTSSVVSSRIAATGKIVTIAAGNDGTKGTFFASSPATGINAISVASVDNIVIPLQNVTVHGVVHDPITYFSTFPLVVNGTLPIFATSTDTTVVDDACDPLPDDTPDLSQFVVIVRRGTCTFVQKLTNVAAFGGNISLIYDDGVGFEAIAVGNFTSSLIQEADGVFLVNEFASGVNVSLSFPQVGGSTGFPDSTTGGLVSSFSSYGPSNDMFFKPAVAAPGGNILSTFPVPLGSFALLSGTSMATPFIAGVSALLFGVKGTSPDVGLGARTLFETTAQRISSNVTDGVPLQTVSVQGAGLVNAFNALTAEVIVSPGELLLNDTAHFKGTQTFTVQNVGTVEKKFNVTHIPAGTALSLQPGTPFPEDGPVPLSTQFATVKFSETSFTVHPGQTQEITAHITPPSGVDPSILPIFSGFIEIASGTESYQVTYLGLAASLINAQVVDDSDVFFGVDLPVIIDASGNFQNTTTNYTFVGADFPSVLMRLTFGTPELRIDLVDANINFKPTILTRDVGESHVFERETFSFPQASGGSFAQVKIAGPLLQADFLPRNSDVDDGTGFNEFSFTEAIFSNGTLIPNGSYRFLLRVLKVTGDPTNEADFESWLSPIIGVDSPA
ncbi:subtilisin-like protease [Obba rivulosa]|uniref:Subtilisin-like protease n=1 Tax=Obba rivulosa TaxID=1052685 RepID=A0A8E2AGS6_9APHY|nr:subtilisin-like protease [Obba rivulosa]